MSSVWRSTRRGRCSPALATPCHEPRALLTEAPWGRTAALLAGGAPVELRLERPPEDTGAVWRGRVVRVQPGLGAFVDLGDAGTGLLAGGKPPR